LKKIKSAATPFVSRGDRSGTHIAELDLWKLAGIDIAKEKRALVKDTGQGMGPALNTASAMNGLHPFRSRHLDLIQEPRRTRHRGGRRQALVQPVRRDAGQPVKHPNVKKDLGQSLRRLGDLGGKGEGDCRVQDRRGAAVLPNAGTPGHERGQCFRGGHADRLDGVRGILAPGEGLAQERKSLVTTRLEITGEVQRKLSLSVEDLRGLAQRRGQVAAGGLRRHPPLFTFVLGKVGSLETTKPLMFNTGKV